MSSTTRRRTKAENVIYIFVVVLIAFTLINIVRIPTPRPTAQSTGSTATTTAAGGKQVFLGGLLLPGRQSGGPGQDPAVRPAAGYVPESGSGSTAGPARVQQAAPAPRHVPA